MTFLWPGALLLLAALPLLVALYVFVLRRRKRLALQYSSLSLIRGSVGKAQSAKRHVPPALFLLALLAMLLAAARPAALVTLPSQHETVILAMDVSGSMSAKDVKPSRLAAAQAAAKAFASETPRSTRIGIVAFAGSAQLVQPPTANRSDIFAAIEQFQLQHATAVGSGILVSLKAIFPDLELDPFNPKKMKSAAAGGTAPAKPGSYASAAIILLTDGQTTTGPDPVDAARLAAARGVRVFTVGIGTPEGEILTSEGWTIRVRLDEEPLKQIAGLTQAEYFYAGNAVDLKKVYQGLNSRLVLEKKETEITALFAVAAALLAVVSAALSLLWFNRIL